jgi:hypothetical protein
MCNQDIFEELSANLRSFRAFSTESEPGGWQVEITDWIDGFITKPHPFLGRKGAICPFVQKSIDGGLIAITHLSTPPNIEKDSGLQIIDAMRALFERTFVGDRRELGALILVFPDLVRDKSGSFIDGAHRLNRRRIIKSGLALGEFHPGSTTPGIHNADFHPLYSPLPSFVMRSLGKHDIFFLNREDFAIEDRIDSMRSFIDQMSGYMTSRERLQLDKDLISLRDEAEKENLPEDMFSDLAKMETNHQ